RNGTLSKIFEYFARSAPVQFPLVSIQSLLLEGINVVECKEVPSSHLSHIHWNILLTKLDDVNVQSSRFVCSSFRCSSPLEDRGIFRRNGACRRFDYFHVITCYV